ncbi:uncharacterized protein LOC111389168 isoform X1 [Olea europaea var. sylvestris]|uniref:uncharacterized protein LOC111389168 isoform X1 n=1 Tax=Olea europaea var. sylvestris TaxID=158386 RepID=UPI000C1D545C|nr:uncharacterized protein LOC111389168 isoform X1 [Olea europaea var. sylvestris]
MQRLMLSLHLLMIVKQLGTQFSLKDLGNLHFFLSVEVIPTSSGLFLSQHKYIRDLLYKTSMEGAKDVTIPLSTSVPLKLCDSTSSMDNNSYRQVIGSLQYLCMTRLYISYAINKLSHFMYKLTVTHWATVKRLLRYLKNTIFHGLQINSSAKLVL